MSTNRQTLAQQMHDPLGTAILHRWDRNIRVGDYEDAHWRLIAGRDINWLSSEAGACEGEAKWLEELPDFSRGRIGVDFENNDTNAVQPIVIPAEQFDLA